MKGVVRYIANLLMYLTSEKADIIKVGAAANTTKVRKGKATALPHSKVGYRQSFRISRDVDLNKSVTGVSGGRIQVSVRHVVSGHWKYQPCGKGRAERKHIWVEPYFRGPDIAEVVGRTVEC